MKVFYGCGVALVTPMKADGSVDYEAFNCLINFMITSGVNFIVPVGTTGESPTLSYEEHKRIISYVVECVDGRVPVLAGTGANSTREAVDFTISARDTGADGVLVVSPYYNKPEPSGMRDYYENISAIGLPVCLYDIPGRTGRGVPTELVCALAHEGVIQSMKWADGDFNNLMYIHQNTPEDFTILSGDDAYTFPAMSLGADGVISVVANVYPEAMTNFINACATPALLHEAREMHYALLDVIRAMFIETNPVPVKTALEILYGTLYGGANFRSPMMPMILENRTMLENALHHYEAQQ